MSEAPPGAPELRVAILAAATGIYEEILRRKTPALAAEDLSLALDEGTTSSMQLLAAFSPEDRVRYLDARRIWDFIADDHFWRYDPEATDEQRQPWDRVVADVQERAPPVRAGQAEHHARPVVRAPDVIGRRHSHTLPSALPTERA